MNESTKPKEHQLADPYQSMSNEANPFLNDSDDSEPRPDNPLPNFSKMGLISDSILTLIPLASVLTPVLLKNIALITSLNFSSSKVDDSDLKHSKLKIPSEIKPPLKMAKTWIVMSLMTGLIQDVS